VTHEADGESVTAERVMLIQNGLEGKMEYETWLACSAPRGRDEMMVV
jgi:hypothetical protein